MAERSESVPAEIWRKRDLQLEPQRYITPRQTDAAGVDGQENQDPASNRAGASPQLIPADGSPPVEDDGPRHTLSNGTEALAPPKRNGDADTQRHTFDYDAAVEDFKKRKKNELLSLSESMSKTQRRMLEASGGSLGENGFTQIG